MENSNGDSHDKQIRQEIYNYYFEYGDAGYYLPQFEFLNTSDDSKEIENRIEFVISKIIMHEHEDGFSDLLHEYTLPYYYPLKDFADMYEFIKK